MSLAVVTSRLRVEEKLILDELDRRGVEYTRLDDGDLSLDLHHESPSPRTVWNRSLAFGRTLYATRVFERHGVRCVNSAHVVETCGDKVLTSLALERGGVPTLRTAVAFTPAAALAAMERFGYPVVIKPVVGSWGRLVARLDGPAAAEAVLESRGYDQVSYEGSDMPGADGVAVYTD